MATQINEQKDLAITEVSAPAEASNHKEHIQVHLGCYGCQQGVDLIMLTEASQVLALTRSQDIPYNVHAEGVVWSLSGDNNCMAAIQCQTECPNADVIDMAGAILEGI